MSTNSDRAASGMARRPARRKAARCTTCSRSTARRWPGRCGHGQAMT